MPLKQKWDLNYASNLKLARNKKNAGENSEKESDFLKTLVESVNNFNYQPNTSTKDKETPLANIGTHP